MKRTTSGVLSQEDHYVCKHEKCQRGSLRLVCLQHRRRVVSWHEELRSLVRAAFWMGFVVDSWSHLAEVAARGEGPLVQARSKLVCVQLSFCHTDAFMITA